MIEYVSLLSELRIFLLPEGFQHLGIIQLIID